MQKEVVETMNDNPVNEGWKERLGFASGTVLLWALVLTKLLPIASTIQLPHGLRYVDPTGYADFDVPVFSLLTLLGGLGITGLLLGVLHVGARGLWLAAITDNSYVESTAGIDRFCQKTFVSVFSVARYAVLMLLVFPFMFAAIGLQRALHRLFIVESLGFGMVLYFVALVAVVIATQLPLMIWWVRRSSRTKNVQWPPPPINFLFRLIPNQINVLSAIAIPMLFFFIICLTLFLSYKAELVVSDTFYDEKASVVDARINLGGMTSDITKARLVLVNSKRQTIRDLSFVRLGSGNYATRIHLSGLSPGRYGVILEYPYIDMSLIPFHIQRLRREQWILFAM